MYEPEVDYTLWITQFKSIEKLSEQLKFVVTILYSLEGKKQELFEAEIKKFEDIMMDLPFMRKVKLRDALVDDYPAEYYGRDYGGDDPFRYDKTVESAIADISLQLMAVLGRIIKVSKDNELFIDGDM